MSVYIEKAYKLNQFIKTYIPKGFKEAIKKFDFTPYISEENYIEFEKSFLAGTIKEIKDYSDIIINNEKVLRFNKNYVIEAIEEYFKEEFEIRK
jgi:hypothetical protein